MELKDFRENVKVHFEEAVQKANEIEIIWKHIKKVFGNLELYFEPEIELLSYFVYEECDAEIVFKIRNVELNIEKTDFEIRVKAKINNSERDIDTLVYQDGSVKNKSLEEFNSGMIGQWLGDTFGQDLSNIR